MIPHLAPYQKRYFPIIIKRRLGFRIPDPFHLFTSFNHTLYIFCNIRHAVFSVFLTQLNDCTSNDRTVCALTHLRRLLRSGYILHDFFQILSFISIGNICFTAAVCILNGAFFIYQESTFLIYKKSLTEYSYSVKDGKSKSFPRNCQKIFSIFLSLFSFSLPCKSANSCSE